MAQKKKRKNLGNERLKDNDFKLDQFEICFDKNKESPPKNGITTQKCVEAQGKMGLVSKKDYICCRNLAVKPQKTITSIEENIDAMVLH